LNQTAREWLGNLACIQRQTKSFGLRLMKISQYHRKTHSFWQKNRLALGSTGSLQYIFSWRSAQFYHGDCISVSIKEKTYVIVGVILQSSSNIFPWASLSHPRVVLPSAPKWLRYSMSLLGLLISICLWFSSGIDTTQSKLTVAMSLTLMSQQILTW
jgi:hypothetical protein